MARPTSRKQRRKQERQAKRVKNALHFSKKAEGHRGSAGKALKPVYKNGNGNGTRSKPASRKKVRSTVSEWLCSSTARMFYPKVKGGPSWPQQTKSKAPDTSREDVEIAKMEKLLGLKKMKKLPATFEAEGLTCILQQRCGGGGGGARDGEV